VVAGGCRDDGRVRRRQGRHRGTAAGARPAPVGQVCRPHLDGRRGRLGHARAAAHRRPTQRAVLDRVEAVGAEADPSWFPDDGLVHLDPHTDNVLIGDDDTLSGIIDWEGACAGDHRFDLVAFAFDLGGHGQPIWDVVDAAHFDARVLRAYVRASHAEVHRLGDPSPPRGRAAPARSGRARPRSVRGLGGPRRLLARRGASSRGSLALGRLIGASATDMPPPGVGTSRRTRRRGRATRRGCPAR
jgi:hypothetical protein